MKPLPKQVVVDNLRAIMSKRDIASQTELAAKLKMSQRTINALMSERSVNKTVTLDVVDEIARGLGLELWQLLVPNLDPGDLPGLALPKEQREKIQTILRAAQDLPPYAN